jgi:hypothetical protein
MPKNAGKTQKQISFAYLNKEIGVLSNFLIIVSSKVI